MEIRFTSDSRNINDFLFMGRLIGFLEDSSHNKADKVAEVKAAVKTGLINEEEALELEQKKIEDQKRMITSGEDRYFYKKKRDNKVWWLKEQGGEHKFSFDKEIVYNLMTDYPDKLTPEQKEIFDNENPYWVKYFQNKKSKS